jgi:hypothetical protein
MYKYGSSLTAAFHHILAFGFFLSVHSRVDQG